MDADAPCLITFISKQRSTNDVLGLNLVFNLNLLHRSDYKGRDVNKK